MPRKPRCHNEFLAVQYTISTPAESIETVKVKTDELAGAINNTENERGTRGFENPPDRSTPNPYTDLRMQVGRNGT
jgi:hypothetical protein